MQVDSNNNSQSIVFFLLFKFKPYLKASPLSCLAVIGLGAAGRALVGRFDPEALGGRPRVPLVPGLLDIALQIVLK